MKRLLWTIPFLLLIATAGAISRPPSASASGAGSAGAAGPQGFGAALDMDYCYDYLSPFGSWIDLDPYGYVWCPRHMGYRWRPYADGHWIWTDYGWTWLSDYDWGWMPFHYGRWGWDDDCGWFWVPGTVWGPAWVTWRWSDLYLGWAPIPPGLEFRAGMDFDALFMGIPYDFWVFVGCAHFMDRDVRRYVLPYERNGMIVGHTAARNDYGFRGGRMVNQGIDVGTIRRLTRHDVLRYRLADTERPGEGRVVGNDAQFYRPSFREQPGVRPKEFLERNQARRELAPAKVFEPERRVPAPAPETAVRKRQAQERTLLNQSQSQERKTVDRQRSEEARKIRDQAAKAKVQQDYQQRMAEQQKQHQAEKQQMNERHKRDADQVRRSGQERKPTPPPPPPKKK
jgi:hypothetical protein